MKKYNYLTHKPVIFIIIVAIIAICGYFYQAQQTQRLEALYADKTLNLNQDDIKIISVKNQNVGNFKEYLDDVCNNPSYYNNWWVEVRVDVSNFPGDFEGKKYNDLTYRVSIKNVLVDNIGKETSTVSTPLVNRDYNGFTLNLRDVSPESSHTMDICFSLENSEYNIKTNQVCTQYQISKLC